VKLLNRQKLVEVRITAVLDRHGDGDGGERQDLLASL
jgi:hypothetical protein